MDNHKRAREERLHRIEELDWPIPAPPPLEGFLERLRRSTMPAMSDATPEMSEERLRAFYRRHGPRFRRGTGLHYNGYDGTPRPHGTGGKQGVHLWTAMGADGPEITEVLCYLLNEKAAELGFEPQAEAG